MLSTIFYAILTVLIINIQSMYYKYVAVTLVLVGFLGWSVPGTLAQTDVPSADNETAITAEVTTTESDSVGATEVAADLIELEGITANVPEELPTSWGLFWRTVRERVAVVTTFDPIEKAGKQLQFAEERMRLAQLIAEKAPEDSKMQERAEKMINKANAFLQRIEEKKEIFAKTDNERSRRLLKNITTHTLNREAVANKIEEQLKPEQLERFTKLREENSAQSRRLLQALSNENIPAEVKARLETVKTRIETHADEVRTFREEKRELLEKAATGDDAARMELRDANRERLEIRGEQQEETQLERQGVMRERATERPAGDTQKRPLTR